MIYGKRTQKPSAIAYFVKKSIQVLLEEDVYKGSPEKKYRQRDGRNKQKFFGSALGVVKLALASESSGQARTLFLKQNYNDQ